MSYRENDHVIGTFGNSCGNHCAVYPPCNCSVWFGSCRTPAITGIRGVSRPGMAVQATAAGPSPRMLCIGATTRVNAGAVTASNDAQRRDAQPDGARTGDPAAKSCGRTAIAGSPRIRNVSGSNKSPRQICRGALTLSGARLLKVGSEKRFYETVENPTGISGKITV